MDGRIEGVWDYDRQRSNVVLKVEMFEPVTPKVKRGIEKEAQRLAEFLQTQAKVVYDEPE